MANFWENDPVAQSTASASAAEWWKKDPEVPKTDVATDVAKGASYGFNEGLDATLNFVSSPIRGPINYVSEKLGFGEAIPELQLARRANVAGPAETQPGRVAQAVGEVFGSSALPAGGLLQAGRIAGPAASGVIGMASRNPLLTSALESASATGSGLGVATARENELGPLAEVGLGLAGGVAVPNAFNVAVRTYGGVRGGIQYGNRAVRNAMNPEQAAVDTIAEHGVGAGVDWNAMRAAALANAEGRPLLSQRLRGRGITEEGLADIISRSMRGDSPVAIGRDHGIAPSTVQAYVARYQSANPTPMNPIDFSKEMIGEGGASPITRLGRAAYSLAGDDSGEAAQRLMGRQETQPGRVSNIVQRSVAGGDFEATREAGLATLRNEADTAYRQFYNEPELAIDQLGDLMQDPVFRRANIMAQRQERVEIIRRNQEAARQGRPPEPVPTVDPNNQVFTPQQLDLIQRQLRIASEGFASNPNNARHARNLREVFLDRIEDHYPTFRDIRRNYATALGEFGEEGALEAGAALTTRLGAPTREALRGFDTMTPAQQELFRLGFARKLMDDAANPQIGGAIANKFNTTAVREIVERLYPRGDRDLWRQGQQLLRDLRREATTTRTKNDVMVGARTAELGSDMGRMMEGAQTAADVATGRWGKLLENLSTRLSTQIGRRGAQEVLRILTETDPAQLLPTLNRLARSAQTAAQRRAYAQAIREFGRVRRRPAAEIGTVTPSNEGSERRRQQP
jgi:hypothetical protein